MLLIRAEDHRVLFGFWRGKRLLALELRMQGEQAPAGAVTGLKRADA